MARGSSLLHALPLPGCKDRPDRGIYVPHLPCEQCPEAPKMNPSVQFYYSVQGAVERCCPTQLCFPPPPSLPVKEVENQVAGCHRHLPCPGHSYARPSSPSARVAAWFIGSMHLMLSWKGFEKLTGSTFAQAKPFPKETLKGLCRNKAKRACNYLELGSG